MSYKHFYNDFIILISYKKNPDREYKDCASQTWMLLTVTGVLSTFVPFLLSQTFQYSASVRRLAESDLKLLQEQYRKNSVLLRYRLCLHAVCGQCQEGMTQM